jgi:hypothetical protein
MSSSAEHTPAPHAAPHVPAEEQIRQQGIQPIASVDELAFPGVWESDEELDEFLADLYASRRANVALAWSFSTLTSRRSACAIGCPTSCEQLWQVTRCALPLARGRSVFCGTVPRVTPGRRYRPPCPVEPGPSSPDRNGPARPPGRLTHGQDTRTAASEVNDRVSARELWTAREFTLLPRTEGAYG